MSHLDAGMLHALLDGEIPSAELGAIQAHLAACAECRARLEEERQLVGESDSLVEAVELPAGGPAPVIRRSPPSRRGLVRGLAWAATVVVAVGVGYVGRGVEQPAPKQEVAAAVPATGSDSAPALAPPPSRESAGLRSAAEGSAARDAGTVSGESGRRARSNLSRDLAQGKPAGLARQEVTPLAAAPPAARAAAPAATPAESLSSAKAGSAGAVANLSAPTRPLGQLRLEEVVVTGVAEKALRAAPMLATPEPIGFADAIRRLGGTLRLIDGLVPLRLEAQGVTVRVVYSTAQGELVLSQQLVDGLVEFRLVAPAGFPADSLARLRARVRE